MEAFNAFVFLILITLFHFFLKNKHFPKNYLNIIEITFVSSAITWLFPAAIFIIKISSIETSCIYG